jgi:hypothetical protein
MLEIALLPPRAKKETWPSTMVVMLIWTGVKERVERQACWMRKKRKSGML